MKQIIILAFTILISSCGPNKAQLRAELQSIDRELMELRTAAYRHQSEMSQAEFGVLINSFAAGYGAVSEDYQLAGEGVGGAYSAANQHDVASYSLDQIRARQRTLSIRRVEVVEALN